MTIAALYKSRWQVELFFKWIKQHLRIKRFLGTSENAVKTQIWCAVSTYVLIAIVKKELHLDASLYTLLQILSVSVFEKTHISCALQRKTARDPDCANHRRPLFRIIQSIPSPRAEPFKRWLAQVGYERVKEIENPELASARARELYQAKGYPQAWIEKRLRSIAVRGELTDEWKERGVQEGREYSILTAEIARATFGVTPGAHSRLKGLDKVKTGNNLRDHMTDLELIFTMLGEAGTTEIARRKDAQGFADNRTAAKEGGTIAGDARKALEAKSGKPVVSKENYLAPPVAAALEDADAAAPPAKRKASRASEENE